MTSLDSDTADAVLLVGVGSARSLVRDALPDSVSVAAVDTAEAAVDAVAERSPELVVTRYDLPGEDGVALAERLGRVASDLPVVLCGEGVSGAVASAALAAGATDFVALEAVDEASLRSRLARFVGGSSADFSSATSPDRAAARSDDWFEAVFSDPTSARWILGGDGDVRRMNGTARKMVDSCLARGRDGAADRGNAERPSFARLPMWASDHDADRVRSAIDDATAGTARTVANLSITTGDAESLVRLSVRPVGQSSSADDAGATERAPAVLVMIHDVTERAELEFELRRSEAIHRVTLNNMTDTVLVTNDDGEFTYICPNVHFIFEYAVEEIEAMGTIDELLGPEILDPQGLEDDGVLTNIECTATDKRGVEHHLLVNVKRVSIPDGGTILYSCRDITTRKQRERALSVLHETARELQYAETVSEVGRVLSSDAARIVDADAACVFRFDDSDNRLVPEATDDDEGLLASITGTHRLDGDSTVARAFVAGEPTVASVSTGGSPLQALVVPLSGYGALVVGRAGDERFDEVTAEVADLVAATAEAALDRLDREAALKRQERELRRRNQRLTRLNRVNDLIRETDAALVAAETVDEIERAVCERLTESERFAFAWFGRVDTASDSLTPSTRVGTDDGYLDAIDLNLGADAAEPSVAAAESSEPVVEMVTTDIRREPWRSAAAARGFQAALAVPVGVDDLDFGVLTVYAARRDAFDETTRAVFAELGDTIGAAMSAARQRQALLANAVTELDYEFVDERFVFLRIARMLDCRFEQVGGIERLTDGYVVFARLSGAGDATDDLVERFTAVTRVRRLTESDDGRLYRIEVDRVPLIGRLLDHGATIRAIDADSDRARVGIEVPSGTAVRAVHDAIRSELPDATLIAQRERSRSINTPAGEHSRVVDQLTPRQHEVLRTAYYSGYFEAPRRRSGEDVADALDVTPSGFYQLVRTVQRKVFRELLEETDL